MAVIEATPTTGTQAAPQPVTNNGEPSTPSTQAPPPEPEFEVKVDGSVRKYKRSEAERLLSKAGFADKIVRQTKEELKRLKQIEAERQAKLEAAKEKPDELLRLHGVDPDEFARRILERKIAEGQLTPEQRRIAELEEAHRAEQARVKELESKQQAEQMKVMVARLQKQMEDDLYSAAQRAGLVEANGSMDSDAFYAVYDAVREAHELGLLQKGLWDPDHIVQVAQANLDNAFKRLETSALKTLKGKALIDRLGEKVVAEVLRYKAEEARGKRALTPTPVAPTEPKKPANNYLSPAEADAELKRLVNGRG